MSSRTQSIVTKFAVAAALILTLAGCTATGTSPTPSPVTPSSAPAALPASPSAAPAATATSSTLDLLGSLPVKGKSPMTGYDREGMFGSPWLDTDRNGCDTRNDILARDLTGEVLEGPCKVLTGTLADPYTGMSISFVRGNRTSTLVQIDHVVALGSAWETGAQALTQDQRVALANDPLNLLAVDGPANSAKGKGDTATWLPANKGFRCEYVSVQVQVKAKYGLWVTEAERTAMSGVLSACSDLAAAAPVAAAPEPVPAEAAPANDSPVYENCDAVRAAGAAPITAADPGWQPKFDRDSDGVGCL